MHNRGAPAAKWPAGQRVRNNLGVLRKQCVDRPPEVADALAVNDPHAKDAARLALGEVIAHDRFDVLRPERMQVQYTVDGQIDRGSFVASVLTAVVLHGPFMRPAIPVFNIDGASAFGPGVEPRIEKRTVSPLHMG